MVHLCGPGGNCSHLMSGEAQLCRQSGPNWPLSICQNPMSNADRQNQAPWYVPVCRAGDRTQAPVPIPMLRLCIYLPPHLACVVIMIMITRRDCAAEENEFFSPISERKARGSPAGIDRSLDLEGIPNGHVASRFTQAWTIDACIVHVHPRIGETYERQTRVLEANFQRDPTR